jgi:alkylated DNA repair protein (DNA oxidative demethylase)
MDLFPHPADDLALGPGALLLKNFAGPHVPDLMAAVENIAAAAPFRQMLTPGGKTMSAAMTNCGAVGWVSDRRGYRYSATDPQTGNPWPPMPALFAKLARDAADSAGYADFTPDVCLLNRYEPGAKMALHQDRDEQDFTAPIVSVSLGLTALFLWGGKTRADKPRKVTLEDGDVLVWGGASRLNFHGIAPLKPGPYPHRTNLTFRKAG